MEERDLNLLSVIANALSAAPDQFERLINVRKVEERRELLQALKALRESFQRHFSASDNAVGPATIRRGSTDEDKLKTIAEELLAANGVPENRAGRALAWAIERRGHG